MKKKVASILFLSSMLFAKEMDLNSLLITYNQESDLSNETKKEAAGYVTIFTREDLDRMQAYTLNDILNSIRIFNLEKSRKGFTAISKAGSKTTMGSPVTIFIDSHMVENTIFGNSIDEYGKLNLYFVDHIEVYQAGNSLSFGNDGGGMIIKIYTKQPERENGTFTNINVDNKGTFNINLLKGEVLEDSDYSYLFNANIRKDQSNDYNNGDIRLKDGMKEGVLFFKFSKKSDYAIQTEVRSSKKDGFALLGLSPKDNYIKEKFGYINIAKNLPKDLKFKFSASYKELKALSDNSKTVTTSYGYKAKKFYSNISTSSLTTTIESKREFKNSDLFFALQHKFLSFDVKNLKLDGVEDKKAQTFLNLFSIYSEDKYFITDKSTLYFGAKYDIHKYSGDYNQKNYGFTYRVGHIFDFGNMKNRIFLFNINTQPTMTQSTFSPIKIKSNNTLKPIKSKILTDDIEFKPFDKTTLHFGVGTAKVENAIVVDKKRKEFVNSKQNLYYSRIYPQL